MTFFGFLKIFRKLQIEEQFYRVSIKSGIKPVPLGALGQNFM